jgi:hypothetical protein
MLYSLVTDSVVKNSKNENKRVVKSLTRRVAQIYMNSFFPSPNLFVYLFTRSISCHGNVKQNHKGILGGFGGMTV